MPPRTGYITPGEFGGQKGYVGTPDKKPGDSLGEKPRVYSDTEEGAQAALDFIERLRDRGFR